MQTVDNSTLLTTGPASWVLLAGLLAIAATLWRTALGRRFRDMVIAGVRALVQLAVVALVIVAARRATRGWRCCSCCVMFTVAAWTSGHRIAPRGRWWAAAVPDRRRRVPIGALMFVTGVLPWNALALIAVLGQQIGGAMATTTLCGRRVEDELAGRRGRWRRRWPWASSGRPRG